MTNNDILKLTSSNYLKIFHIIHSHKCISAKKIIQKTTFSPATVYRVLENLHNHKIIKYEKNLGNLGSPPKYYTKNISEVHFIFNGDSVLVKFYIKPTNNTFVSPNKSFSICIS